MLCRGMSDRLVQSRSSCRSATLKTPAVDLEVVTDRHPSEDELKAMLFGWRAVKHLKSNAILYAGKDRTQSGRRANEPSGLSRIAVWKAGEAGLDLKGSAVCSDAFFPFADGLIAAAEAGATAIHRGDPSATTKSSLRRITRNGHGLYRGDTLIDAGAEAC